MRVREANEVLGTIKTPEEGYKALAAAVIAVACDDYIRASSSGDSMRQQTIERFLLGETFMMLSQGVEGGYILRKLREAVIKYDEPKEAKCVRQYDEYGRVIADHPSLAEAARNVNGDRHSIRRAIASGRMVFGYYWGFAAERK